MSVANGRALLAMPGPTNIPDRVLQAMMRPAEELASKTIVELTGTLLADLKTIFRTTGETFLYAANGHGGWEAALTNVLSRGDKILVLASGRFAIGWGEMARFMGAGRSACRLLARGGRSGCGGSASSPRHRP